AVRDQKLGVRELLRSSGLHNRVYVLGKFAGVALSMISIELLTILLISTFSIVLYSLPLYYILDSLLAVFTISAPGILFITAFSISVPLFIPIRVYQILFTGYWYWGNYLSPTVLPTVSDTVLNACGKFALQGLYHVQITANDPSITVLQVLMNIGVLLLFAGLALTAMIILIGNRENRDKAF
ncbi:MAG: hypothetical protein JEZ06_22860, partial [Anaerolineaceae bacterium]|nr:hypothetical protein [Anaerolineaceae bacterium]